MSDSTHIYCIKVCHKIGVHFMTPLNFRAAAGSLYYYDYELCILVAPDKVVVDGYSWNLRINSPDYFACQLSRKVRIKAHVMEIYDGQALPPLLIEPYDGSAFPLAYVRFDH
ncbi:hypothetical protein H4218_002186 [Coemansia sp. IMI 209128]|nr:hypothetical protein H4218_002186 [Coemansia sp. IMI 209128]